MIKKITIKTICLAMALFSTGAFAQIPFAGLVGYFPFTGNANDQSGSGIIGTPSTGYISANTPPVLAPDRFAAANSAYDFEPSSSSSSFITLGQPSQFNFGTSSSFSISLWMKYVDFQVSATMFENSAWHFAIRNLSGNDHLNFVFGTADFISDTLLHTGTWVQVAAVYNQSAHTIEMYINGAHTTGFPWNGGNGGPSVSSLNTSTMTLDGTPTGNTQIGQIDAYPSTGIMGVLDDILIYNRALTSSEVAAIYTATGGPAGAGIEEQTERNYFMVSPNPGNGLFILTLANAITCETTLKVYAMDGRLVKEQKNVTKKANRFKRI